MKNTKQILEELITLLGMTDAEFGRTVGLSKQAISDKLRVSVSLDKLREMAIAHVMGVELVLHNAAEPGDYSHEIEVAMSALSNCQVYGESEDEKETQHQNAVMAAIDALSKSPFFRGFKTPE